MKSRLLLSTVLLFAFLFALLFVVSAEEDESSAVDEKMTIEIIDGENVDYLDPDWVVIGMDEYETARRKTEEATQTVHESTLVLVGLGCVILLVAATAVLLVARKKRRTSLDQKSGKKGQKRKNTID